MAVEHRLDLAELDAVAADLDLVVGSPGELDVARSGGCARRRRWRTPGPCPGDRRTARRSARAGRGSPRATPSPPMCSSPKVPTGRRRPSASSTKMVVLPIGVPIGTAAVGGSVDLLRQRPDRRLRRPVHVRETSREQPADLRCQRRRQGLAAEHQVADAAEGCPVGRVGDDHRGERRRALQVCHAVSGDESGDRVVDRFAPARSPAPARRDGGRRPPPWPPAAARARRARRRSRCRSRPGRRPRRHRPPTPPRRSVRRRRACRTVRSC